MPGPRRSHAERRIIFTGHLSDLTCGEISRTLKAAGFRTLPQGSYSDFERNYKPVLKRHPELFEKWVQHPPRRSDLPKD